MRPPTIRPSPLPHTEEWFAGPRARTEFALRAPWTYHWDTWCRAGVHVPHFSITVVVWVGGPNAQEKAWAKECRLARRLSKKADLIMRNARDYSPGRPTRSNDHAGFLIYLGLS